MNWLKHRMLIAMAIALAVFEVFPFFLSAFNFFLCSRILDVFFAKYLYGMGHMWEIFRVVITLVIFQKCMGMLEGKRIPLWCGVLSLCFIIFPYRLQISREMIFRTHEMFPSEEEIHLIQSPSIESYDMFPTGTQTSYLIAEHPVEIRAHGLKSVATVGHFGHIGMAYGKVHVAPEHIKYKGKKISIPRYIELFVTDYGIRRQDSPDWLIVWDKENEKE